MKFSTKALVASLFLATTLAPIHASAFGLGATRDGVKTRSYSKSSAAPLAYQVLCLTQPKECRGGGRSAVKYSSSLMKKLTRVNAKVNRQIRPRNDKGDIWTVGARSGDCEDYALTKRRDLIRAGVPAGALRMAVVYTRRGVGHAVLVVKTNKGDYVLDNRRKKIVKRQATGYRFVKMASSNPYKWINMKNKKTKSKRKYNS